MTTEQELDCATRSLVSFLLAQEKKYRNCPAIEIYNAWTSKEGLVFEHAETVRWAIRFLENFARKGMPVNAELLPRLMPGINA